MIQGTPEWYEVRLGRVTASRVADVIARTKTGWGASRANYMAQLVAERLTGIAGDSYTNEAMRWGAETEPQAREMYAFMAGVTVDEVGFVEHPAIPMAGASPDGLVGDAGLVEIKCPNTATHIESLLGAPIADKYLVQMQWQMACTGRAWCDFVSFDPRMPLPARIIMTKVERDADRIAELEAAVQDFLAELARKEAAIRQRYIDPASDDAGALKKALAESVREARSAPLIMAG